MIVMEILALKYAVRLEGKPRPVRRMSCYDPQSNALQPFPLLIESLVILRCRESDGNEVYVGITQGRESMTLRQPLYNFHIITNTLCVRILSSHKLPGTTEGLLSLKS